MQSQEEVVGQFPGNERKVCVPMSSDGKDPGAIWSEGPAHSGQSQSFEQAEPDANQSFDQAQSAAQDEMPPLPDRQPDGALHLSPLEEEQDADEDDFTPPASTPGELLRQFGQYITLVLAPLLFGALTCLFVLPLVATGRAWVPPAALWPVAFVIIVVAVAQGVAIYYAGTNNGMWALGTVGGFFLFVLIGCFAIFGLTAAIVLFIALLIISVVLMRLYVHPVPDGYVDIVYTFGKYSRTLDSGFNILLPWEKVVHQLNVEETQWDCPAQKVQLSPDEDVKLRAILSYRLMPEDAHLAVTQVQNWEESLHNLFRTTLQSIATTFSPSDFLAWSQSGYTQGYAARGADGPETGEPRWARVNDYLFRQMRDRAAPWGVQVNWVRIYDVVIAPHGAIVMDTEPVVSAQTAGEKVAQKAAPAQAAAQAAKAAPSPAASNPQPKDEPAQPAARPATPAKLLKEEVLIKAYKEVQSGNITDPDTIRGIAEKFEAVARDEKASQTVSFDPARAALNLYDQAKKYEALYNAGPLFTDETRPDWVMRRPTDENLMAGG